MASRYVTAAGRVKTTGRVTRKGTAVKRHSQEGQRPLTLDEMCYPMALTRTPLNPECYSSERQIGHARRIARDLTPRQIMAGWGLAKSGRFELQYTGKTVGFSDDGFKALGFAQAAHRAWALTMEVIDHG